MMPMNLKDYVKVYDALDEKQCKKIVKQITSKEIEWKKHSYYDYAANKSQSFDDDLFVTHGTNKNNEISDDLVKLNESIWHLLKQYHEEFSFPWMLGWNGYSLIRFNRYDKNCNMKVHCDHIRTLFDGERKGVPVLTVLGSLNNNYTGGDLIMWESEKLELKAGQIVVFPSNFMYPHRITSITKGTRYSFVSWVW